MAAQRPPYDSLATIEVPIGFEASRGLPRRGWDQPALHGVDASMVCHGKTTGEMGGLALCDALAHEKHCDEGSQEWGIDWKSQEGLQMC